MIAKLLIALLLMAFCVAIHAIGLTAAVRRLRRYALSQPLSFEQSVGLLIAIAAWAILLHLLQIAVWAVFYALEHGMPDLPTALYFSAVTYTTTGYGDLVLPPEWRLVGGVEALTGILMLEDSRASSAARLPFMPPSIQIRRALTAQGEGR